LRRQSFREAFAEGTGGLFAIIATDLAVTLKRERHQTPAWLSAGGYAKLSTAWLIEASEFKESRDDDANTSRSASREE